MDLYFDSAVTGQRPFSMASDFFNLSLTTAKERERNLTEAKYRTAQTPKSTWNPFRRNDKSRERDAVRYSPKSAASATSSADDTYYRNIILR